MHTLCVYGCHDNFHYITSITLSTLFSSCMLSLPVRFFCCGWFGLIFFNKGSETLIWAIVRCIEALAYFV